MPGDTTKRTSEVLPLPGQAIRDADASLTLLPRGPDAFAVRGYARADQGHLAEAIDDLEHALRIAPDHPDARTLRRNLEALRRQR